MASKLRVPVGDGMHELEDNRLAHHIQTCLMKIRRPFRDIRELNEFVGLKEEPHRREFIASRVPSDQPAAPLAAPA